jgi:hypothetical protein
MKLLEYLKSIPTAERSAFAEACSTSLGHMNNVAYGYKPCGESLAIAVERESHGKSTVEENCPDVDWAVIRGKASPEPVPAPGE